MELSARNMPAVDYQIREVKGDDSNIEYDKHIENVRVLLTDDGGSDLKYTIKYDSGNEAIFVNNVKGDYSGKLTVNKTVNGKLADNSDEFKFDLYLTSDSINLNERTFNYKLDDQSGTFTFKKVEKDGVTKFKTLESFKLKNGSKLEFTDLPVGATYEVEEADYTAEGYTLTSKSGATGTVSKEGSTANFTNTKNTIVPTSADTFTRSSFWIIIALGSLIVIYLKIRKKKLSHK